MQARYYDPVIGRFYSNDPQGFTNVHNFNRYAYANNNPYKYIDPDGQNALTAFGGLIYETGQFLQGNGFDGEMVMGALADGYNGDGAGFAASAAEDVLSFGGGAIVGAFAKGVQLLRASKVATQTAKEMGILREAAKGEGNFGLGSATKAESEKLGQAWVGEGSRISKDGSSIVSKDGLKVYRPPTAKPNSSQATTGVQANFERKTVAGTKPVGNGHLDIVD